MDLQRELARLESINDHLMTQVAELDHLLQQIGFDEGLQTLKTAALDLQALELEQDSSYDDGFELDE